jgi:GMP synthase (glutamine-hydrolysing)
MQMFENFLRKICGLSATYTFQNREKLCIDYIKDIVGDKKVLVMVSGGVDSTVCAALLNRALGKERVVAVHIDNGFMRYKESENVVKALKELGMGVFCKFWHT